MARTEIAGFRVSSYKTLQAIVRKTANSSHKIKHFQLVQAEPITCKRYISRPSPPAKGARRKASLVAVELETGKLSKPRLRRIASEADFKRFDANGEDPYAVEKAISAIEGEISPALQEVIAARGIL